MVTVMLLTEILRKGAFPIVIPIIEELKNNYITLTPFDWIAMMYYELPRIEFKLYTFNKSLYKSDIYFDKVVDTYHPIFPLDLDQSYCFDIPDIVQNSFLSISPLFDENSIKARNELITKGVEEGEIWSSGTAIFPISISLTST